MFPKSLFRPHFRALVGSARPVLAALIGTLVLGGELAAQSRPDQVLWRNPAGRMKTDSGKVTEHSLARVVIEVNGREKSIDSANVERVSFGQTPASFQDGRSLFDRGEFESAAVSYRKAADDASSSPVVAARARLLAGHSLLAAGAADPTQFDKARVELETFVSDHSDSLDLGHARWSLGRAQLMSGEPAAAAATFGELFGEIPGGTPNEGYRASRCLRAGIDAGHAWLAAGDAAKAGEAFRALESPMATALGTAEEGSAARFELQNLQAEARLGEGFVLLASDSVSQAKTFFNGQLGGANGDATLRYGAVLGLGEALLAEGKAREAQIEFARVSALDHTDRDRVARALVGLAEAAMKLPDEGSSAMASTWLASVREQYPDSIWTTKAQELADKL